MHNQGSESTNALDRLHADGWSISDTAFYVKGGGLVHVVIGSSGEGMVRTEGATWRGGGHSIVTHRMRDG